MLKGNSPNKKEMKTEVLEIQKEMNIDYPTCHYDLRSY